MPRLGEALLQRLPRAVAHEGAAEAQDVEDPPHHMTGPEVRIPARGSKRISISRSTAASCTGASCAGNN